MRDRNFIKWYRSSYRKIKAAPPEEAWENIAAALDKKDNRERKRFLIYISSLSVIILGALFFTLEAKYAQRFYGKPERLSFIPKQAAHFKRVSAQATGEGGGFSGEKIAPSVNKKQAPVRHTLMPDITKSFVNDQVPTGPMHEDASLRETASTEFMAVDGRVISLPVTAPVYRPAIMSLRIDSPLVTIAPERFYAGALIGFNNVWIVNSNLIEATHKTSLSYLVPVYNASASFLAGARLTQRIDLNAELSSSKFEQKYISYNEGVASSNYIALHYLQINALLRFKSHTHKLGSNYGYRVSTLIGLHSGYLLNCENGNASAGAYSKFNSGITTGQSLDLVIGKHFMISTGLRANIGLQNVYKGNSLLPRDLDKTHNVSFSWVNGLIYRF